MQIADRRAAGHGDKRPPDRSHRLGRMIPVRIENGEADRGAAFPHLLDPGAPCMFGNSKLGTAGCGDIADYGPVHGIDPADRLAPASWCQVEQSSGGHRRRFT